ncbi:hypothetical protein ACJX0J_030036 [Zea mays]
MWLSVGTGSHGKRGNGDLGRCDVTQSSIQRQGRFLFRDNLMHASALVFNSLLIHLVSLATTRDDNGTNKCFMFAQHFSRARLEQAHFKSFGVHVWMSYNFNLI